MRLLAISGSLRAGSANTAVLRAAALVAPADVEVELYDGLAALPAFNPDDDEPGAVMAPAVQALRDRVARADGLLICSPEYAHGVPGSLKNLLDWLVSSVDFPGKPVTLLSASARSVHAQAQLVEVLRTMSARLTPAEAVPVPLPSRAMDAETIAADPSLAAVLRETIAALRAASANDRISPRSP